MPDSASEVGAPALPALPTVPVLGKLSASPRNALTKIMLVQFRNGEAVTKHPELKNLLEDGWSVRSAVPRLVESQGTRLLVVLGRHGTPPMKKMPVAKS